MTLLANQITIAVTVYNRRQFIKQAVASALDQSVPVRVVVVEDCGPDATLESFVKQEFGSRIQYVRNPTRRGLFGNWNACLEICQTEWLTILHDDDFLAPKFIESMIELEKEAPGCALYLGRTLTVNQRGEPEPVQDSRTVSGRWMKRGLVDILYGPFWFAGHLFRVADAKAVGGFRATSFMCGDWEMWAKLVALGGAAQSSQIVAFNRNHEEWGRGTNQSGRTGRHFPTAVAQHKRILALMAKGKPSKFDRLAWQQRQTMPTRYLFQYGHALSPRLLNYHVKLLLLSTPPHWRYAVYQWFVKVGGAGFVRCSSRFWNQLNKINS
jgi:glycosyltransferase involved in cell wall biosynthesis